jgi:HEAT repeat protein
MCFLIAVSTNYIVRADQTYSELAINDLVKKVEGGNADALLEMGRRGDKSVVPYLQALWEKTSKDSRSETNPKWVANIQMALAKLGEKKQVDEIWKELKNDDPSIQTAAIKKLTYVGGNQAVLALVNLLDNSVLLRGKSMQRSPSSTEQVRQGVVFFGPLNLMAMEALGQIVPNPPVLYTNEIKAKQDDVKIWKDWWEKNKSKYSP